MCLATMASDVEEGDRIELYRDNDTRTYRVFCYEGDEPVIYHGREMGSRFRACANCDLSIDGLKALAEAIQKAIDAHTPWDKPPVFNSNAGAVE